MTKVCIIINGSRKLNSDSLRTIKLIEGNGQIESCIISTTRSKHAVELAKVNAHKFDIIIAVGGDGTCNEVVNGIQLSKNPDVGFAIIPNGTGNDFQRMIGKFEPDNFSEAIIRFKFKQIDLCKVESDTNVQYALNISGAGFDGYVVNKLNRQRQLGLKGKLSYSWAIIRSFFTFKKPVVDLVADSDTYQGELLMIAVCNGTTFGHGMIINPEAKIDDGMLSVTILGKVSFLDYVRNLSNLKKGVLVEHEQVHYFNSRKVILTKKSGLLFREIDGEVFGEGSTIYSIKPNALNFLIIN